MKTNRKVAALIGLFAVAASSVPALAQSEAAAQTERTIPLSGSGVVEAKPDFARVIVSVSSQAEAVDKASAANKEAVDKAIAKIAALPIPQSDIKVMGLRITQGYSSRKISLSSGADRAFDAVTTVEVLVRDQADAARILGAMFAFDDMRIDSFVWAVTDPQPLRDKAQAAAVADARRRADVYVNAAGAKIGHILSIQETSRDGYEDMLVPKPSSSLSPPATIPFRANVQTIWSIE